jgi:glycosyltransferase involved in cell wall biosynthesis
MMVCLDARGNHFGGVYTYTYSLLRALPAADSDFEYLVLFDQHQVDENRLIVENVKSISVPLMSPLKMVWWNNMVLPKILKEKKIDLYHGFKHFGIRYPKGHDCKMIWTLHSASWWLYPELFSLKERLFWTRYYTLGARLLDQVLCVSHADKKAYVKAIGIVPDKVSVTQLAASRCFVKVADQVRLKQVREKYNLPEDYIIFVGTIYPFKNLETVIKVISKIVMRGDMPHHLVIVGGLSSAYGDSYKKSLVKQSALEGVADRIHWIGSVFDELPALYTMADLLLFPSRFESFGQPPLEAMACETPVVTSNVAGLPEVVGNAGLMRDPNDVEGLSNDVVRALSDQSLRKKLIKKGLDRVEHFSWERCAIDTVKVYRKVLDMQRMEKL